MSIDIQGLPGGLVQNAGDSMQTPQAPSQAPSLSSGQQGGATQRPDTVNLTESATRLRHIEGSLNELPVVDAQRVENVQLQLATGSFTVDPASTADKLLDMERNLP
jgi:flagellar biosynthesis anti-sigma factor FlgM